MFWRPYHSVFYSISLSEEVLRILLYIILGCLYCSTKYKRRISRDYRSIFQIRYLKTILTNSETPISISPNSEISKFKPSKFVFSKEKTTNWITRILKSRNSLKFVLSIIREYEFR